MTYEDEDLVSCALSKSCLFQTFNFYINYTSIGNGNKAPIPYFLRYLKDGGIHHILPLTKVQFLYACRAFSSHSVLLFKVLFVVLIHDTTQLLNMDGFGACSMGWGRETESLLAIFIFTGCGLKSSLNKTFWCHTHT